MATSSSGGDLARGEALEASARKIVDLKAEQSRDTRDLQLIEAARAYRGAGLQARARDLLESFDVELPENSANVAGTNNAGLHDYELGINYQELGLPEKALAAYLRAIERNPTVMIGNGADLLKRIECGGRVSVASGSPGRCALFPQRRRPGRPARRSPEDVREMPG